jgi:hypothetical protein
MYVGIGQSETAQSGGIAAVAQQAAAAAAQQECNLMGGIWDAATGSCQSKTESWLDALLKVGASAQASPPAAEIVQRLDCLAAGGAWDENLGTCGPALPEGLVPSSGPPVVPTSSSTANAPASEHTVTGLLLVGLVVVGGAFLLLPKG